MASSGFKHVAVTGPPGIGKTTFIRNILQKLESYHIQTYGFVTDEVRLDGRRIGFDITTLSGDKAVLSRIEQHSTTKDKRHTVGSYIVDVAAFESLALPLFDEQFSDGSVIILDEIGKMEIFSKPFVKNVQQLISAPKHPLLVSIPINKGRPIHLVENIRNNPSIYVIQLTSTNRNDTSLQAQVVSILKK